MRTPNPTARLCTIVQNCALNQLSHPPGLRLPVPCPHSPPHAPLRRSSSPARVDMPVVPPRTKLFLPVQTRSNAHPSHAPAQNEPTSSSPSVFSVSSVAGHSSPGPRNPAQHRATKPHIFPPRRKTNPPRPPFTPTPETGYH
jgi:hypothetical protein